MKEKLFSALGFFGVILFYILRIIICCLPFVMIGLGFWGTLLLFLVESFLPISTIVFWIWGLIKAIGGVQDFWAVLYYVSFAILFIPFFVSTVLDLLGLSSE